MKFVGRFGSLLGILTLTLGCQHLRVSIPQAQVLRALLPGEESAVNVEQFRWVASLRDAEETLLPITYEGNIVFSDRAAKVYVVFDGWNVLRVAGFLGPEVLSLRTDTQRVLTVSQGGQRVFQGACSDWVALPLGWQQTCEGLGENRIDLDSSGNIVALSFHIHPDYPALRLIRYQGE